VIAVDASAILAIYLREPERAAFLAKLKSPPYILSPVNHWEVLVRAHRAHGSPGVLRVEALLEDLGVEVGTITAATSAAAYRAFTRFGKGQGGPLNLGDCFAYALAQSEGDGLLFKGDDFPRTDVKQAI
jgi:ribonuclease VapC